MIPQDRDRFECLKLAVTLLVPKSNQSAPADLIRQVLLAAGLFVDFVNKADVDERKTQCNS